MPIVRLKKRCRPKTLEVLNYKFYGDSKYGNTINLLGYELVQNMKFCNTL